MQKSFYTSAFRTPPFSVHLLKLLSLSLPARKATIATAFPYSLGRELLFIFLRHFSVQYPTRELSNHLGFFQSGLKN